MTIVLALLVVATAQEPASVGGRIVDDRGEPVAAAVVYLVGGPAPGARPAITTDDGRFGWSGIAPGTYTIAAGKAGYPSVHYGQTRPDGPGTPMQIQGGQKLVLDIRLPRGAVISGTVVDDAGEPVQGRQILLFGPPGTPSAAQRGIYVSSNARGLYRLFGLTAGTYRVAAAPPRSSGPQTDAPAGAVTVIVAAGEEHEGIDLHASATGSTTYVTVRPLPPVLPARALRVGLWREGETRAPFTYGTRNPDGSTTFADVPAGEYRVTVDAGSAWGSGHVTVTGESPASVDVPLAPGVRLSGQVVFDGGSRPPGRLFLSLTPVDPAALGDGASWLSGQMTTNGAFTIAGVPPGGFLMGWFATDAATGWTLQSAKAGDVDMADLPLTVGAADVSGIVVTMTDVRNAALRGTVTVAGGPANGVDVVVYPSDARYRIRNSRRVAAARTTIEGRYEVKDLPPGDYTIAVVDEIDREALKDPAAIARLTAAATVTLARGEVRVQNLSVR